ncbi:MAG: PKD domain-containing protein, partial [Gammaproteobacteria bacterium]|nr:PKD domain-containing protein [Gammaproteobacteria bacterium]
GNVDAAWSADTVSGLAPLNVQFSAIDSSQVTDYSWDFGDGGVGSSSSVNHTFNSPGTYQVELTITDLSGNTYSAQRFIYALASIDNTSAVVPAGVTFYDDFDYTVSRNEINAVNIFQNQGGWFSARTEQVNGGAGYLYTVDSIPGYGGAFPGRNSTRVLAIESLADTFNAQTDFYLQYGDSYGPADTVPGDVWFQFWVYSNYYNDPTDFEDQLSQYSFKNKFIYPCNSEYPCGTHKWIVWNGSANPTPTTSPVLNNGNAYFYVRDSWIGSPHFSGAEVGDEHKIGHNNSSEHLVANNWTLVKIHIDTSRTSGNSFEMWLKPMGASWDKVAEWIGGVTPGFTWNIPSGQQGGHRVFRMPTTLPGGIGTNDTLYDSWLYMDDFAIAVSEDLLPQYPY